MAGAGNQMDVDIDLGRIAAAVWRRRFMIGAVTLAAAGLAAVATMLMDPLYKSETRLLITAREPVYTSGQGQRPQDASFDEATVISQAEILKSADLIKKVATDLDLASHDEFDAAANPSFIKTILIGFGLMKDPFEASPGERVLKAFYEKLEVYALPSTRIIAIAFSSEDPVLAAEITNAMADAYLEFNSGFKLENNTEAAAWLEPEIANLRAKVRDAEENVARYRADKGLLLVNTNDTIAAKQLSDISTELSRVRGERADAEARARTVRAAIDGGQSAETLGDVLGSASVQRLRDRESAVRAQIADLSTTLLDGHPRMKALRAQLDDINAQVMAETRKVLSSLENNAELSRLREEELTGQLNALKSGSAREGEETVELRSLEREAAAQRDLLETYMARYRETASRSEPKSTPADARVISRAVPASEAYFPKTVPIIIVAALSALMLSSIWVMLAELFSGRALRPAEGVRRDEDETVDSHEFVAAERSPRRIDGGETAPVRTEGVAAPRRVQPASILSALPAEPEEEPAFQVANLPNVGNEASDFSVEAVAEQLLADQASIAICVSPEGDEGSATAVMLARTLAGEGARTLLIDLTGSACPTGLMAETPRLSGLSDLLCGEVSIADAIHADRLSNAQIVPHGNANVRRAMRAIERLPMVMDALAEAYDIVIVECGATNAETVARIARRPDAEIILSVVRPSEDDIAAALGDFHDQGFENVLLMTPQVGPNGPDSRRAVA